SAPAPARPSIAAARQRRQWRPLSASARVSLQWIAWPSSASLLSSVRFGELERTCSLRPVAGSVLHQFLEPNIAVPDTDDDAEVLPHVVSDLDLIDVLVGRSDQRVRALAPLQRSDHLQRLQRIGFERLLAPVQIGRELAASLNRLDLARLERIGQVECVVRERLVGPDLRQWIELALDPFALILHPGAQVLMAFAAAGGDEDGGDATSGQSRFHFLALA